MNNQLFSPKRFLHLLYVEWVENWQTKALYRFAAPFLCYLLITLFVFWAVGIQYINSYNIADNGSINWDGIGVFTVLNGWTLGLWAIYLCLMASQMSGQLARKKNRIRWLMLPGSTLEKYLVWLTGLAVCVFVLFPAIVFVVDALRVGIFSMFYPKIDIPWGKFQHIFGDHPSSCTSMEYAHWLLLFFFILSSLYTFGATLWTKISVVKTTLFTGILIALYFWFAAIIVTSFFPRGEGGFSRVTSDLDRNSPMLYTFFQNEYNQYQWAMLLFGLFFYVLAYFRLRETDLTNRW